MLQSEVRGEFRREFNGSHQLESWVIGDGAGQRFAGGGTLTSAITDDPRFKLVAAVELSPKFAAHFALEHPDVPLYQCDIRDLDPGDLPSAAFMFASLPCTCFSTVGVAKKGLKAA